MSDQSSAGRRGAAQGGGRDRKETARLVASLVLGGLLAAFALMNTNRVQVDWILGSWRTPLIVVIVVNLVLGFAAGYLLARRGSRDKRT